MRKYGRAKRMTQVAFYRVYTFSAAHRLNIPEKEAEANREIFGKCNNPNGHGHDYTLEIGLIGPPDPDTGMVIPLSEFDRLVHEVIDPLDHKHLNEEIEYFKTHRSTGEEIIEYLWQGLNKKFGDKVFRIKLWETNNNYFELERKL